MAEEAAGGSVTASGETGPVVETKGLTRSFGARKALDGVDGPFIAVTGCASVGPDGGLVGEGDPYVQAKRCIDVIQEVLESAGAGLGDVVRTRMFVTNIDQWEEIGRAHQTPDALIFGPGRQTLFQPFGLRLVDSS